ncbi:MAG: hypothetical protein JEZ06_03715 [Anaerolineaceae bacterium]|nr:hypothetical protein [Anaerolineaceae bacterium]
MDKKNKRVFEIPKIKLFKFLPFMIIIIILLFISMACGLSTPVPTPTPAPPTYTPQPTFTQQSTYTPLPTYTIPPQPEAPTDEPPKAEKPEVPSNNPNNDYPDPDFPFGTYSGDRFTVRYPADWQVREFEQGNKLCENLDDECLYSMYSADTGVHFELYRGQDFEVTPEIILESFLEEYSDFEILDSGMDLVAGLPSTYVMYTGFDEMYDEAFATELFIFSGNNNGDIYYYKIIARSEEMFEKNVDGIMLIVEGIQIQ